MRNVNYIINKLLISTLFISELFGGCDKVPEGERTVDKPVEVSADHTVLLEEFAGQYCPNCPRAADYVSQLKSALKERVIVVTIHVSSLATDHLRSSAGETIVRTFNGQYMPSGMIDRTNIDGEIINDDDSRWAYYVKKRAEQQGLPNVKLLLESNFNATDSIISIHAAVSGTAGSFTPKLQLYLTENHIIDFQYMPNGTTKQNYEHNHVLRDALNGAWGEEVEFNREYDRTFAVFKGKSWNKDNLNIIGFIYKSDTYEVLYATEIPLIAP
jgi:thiol-disulfide isomerase/thioredoxin